MPCWPRGTTPWNPSPLSLPVPEDDERPGRRAHGAAATWWLKLTVTCAGCPYGTFGQLSRAGIQRSSAIARVSPERTKAVDGPSPPFLGVQRPIDHVSQTAGHLCDRGGFL